MWVIRSCPELQSWPATNLQMLRSIQRTRGFASANELTSTGPPEARSHWFYRNRTDERWCMVTVDTVEHIYHVKAIRIGNFNTYGSEGPLGENSYQYSSRDRGIPTAGVAQQSTEHTHT